MRMRWHGIRSWHGVAWAAQRVGWDRGSGANAGGQAQHLACPCWQYWQPLLLLPVGSSSHVYKRDPGIAHRHGLHASQLDCEVQSLSGQHGASDHGESKHEMHCSPLMLSLAAALRPSGSWPSHGTTMGATCTHGSIAHRDGPKEIKPPIA